MFPTPTATALAIHGLHSGPEGEEAGKKQATCLGVALGCAITLRVVSQYLPGIVWDWHWGWWLHELGELFSALQNILLGTNLSLTDDMTGAKGALEADNWTWVCGLPMFFCRDICLLTLDLSIAISFSSSRRLSLAPESYLDSTPRFLSISAPY